MTTTASPDQRGARGPKRGTVYDRAREKVCAYCGEAFKAARSDAQFCPRPKLCAQKARRKAEKEKPE